MKTTSVHPALRALFLSAAVSGCDANTLAAGDTLSVSIEGGPLRPQPPTMSDPVGARACQAAGGAVVALRAWGADGGPIEGATVALWLDGAVAARLGAARQPCSDSAGAFCVVLDEDGTGGACLLPGERAGAITVHARSGVVTASASTSIASRALAAGGRLTVTVTPIDLGWDESAPAESCGPRRPGGCAPEGAGRRAAVAAVAIDADGTVAADGTEVVLDATAGWLTTRRTCVGTGDVPAGVLALATDDGLVAATWCFDDSGASGAVRASSGAVTATAPTLSVPAIPWQVVFAPWPREVEADVATSLRAVVLGCNDVGIAGVPVTFIAVTGRAELAPSTPVETDESGMAMVTVTASTTAEIAVAALNAPDVRCDAMIEVSQ